MCARVALLVSFQTVTLDEVAPTVHTLRGAPDSSASRCALVQICISPDAQWIATADSCHRIYVHSVDGMCFSSAMPPIASAPTAIAFLTAGSVLAVASANKQLTLYDVERGVITAWSQRHAAPLAAVATSPEVPLRISTNPAHPFAPILCAQSWLCRVEVDGRPADACAAEASPADPNVPPDGKGKNSKGKRKRAATSGATAADECAGGNDSSAAGTHGKPVTRVVRNYGGILHFAVLAKDEAIVVEQPWLRVMDHCPQALYKHRFGS